MIWLRFKKHKIAVLSLVLLLILYVVSIFAEFFTPYDIEKRFPGFENAEPSTIYLFDENNYPLDSCRIINIQDGELAEPRKKGLETDGKREDIMIGVIVGCFFICVLFGSLFIILRVVILTQNT